MKLWKKFLTVLCAGVALVSVAVAAPEANQVLIDQARTASITITKLVADDAISSLPESDRVSYIQSHPDQLKPLEGIEYRVCKVADIEQYSKNNITTVGYAIDSSMANFFALNADTTYDVDTLVDLLKNKTADETQDYLNRAGGTLTMPLTDANGQTTISNLPLGLYLIMETPNDTYAGGNPSFLVSLPSGGSDGWEYDLSIYPKGLLPELPPVETPQTGDNFQLGAVLSIFAIAFIVLVSTIIGKKKKQQVKD